MGSLKNSTVAALGIPIALCAIVGISAGVAWVYMLLWNYGVVGGFGAPALKFGHAWAINVLVGLNVLGWRSHAWGKKD